MPDSQLSAYEKLNWVLGHYNETDIQESREFNNSNEINGIHGRTDSISAIQSNLGETQSQSSVQNCKRCTHEEAQVHCQKLEHECWLKQQRLMDD
ncbi:hypothetical protein O181_098961 [Austropuccinia psidii MF-1]|uniref:Uncharacterized protein n=1 Tax=Austropuccinia psidii MF-1 TaxID=1389203 RepID=A0A9Q3JCH1_9BASI|nr:hypothetical protein [Austropuccinia psidii MF-1]